MSLPITSALLAAGLVILTYVLMINVGLYRGKVSIGVGVGESRDLERIVRRHGNLIENAGIFIIALALAEMIGGTNIVVISLACIFFSTRLVHVIAFSSLSASHLDEGGKFFLLLRTISSSLTALCGFVVSGYLIYLVLA